MTEATLDLGTVGNRHVILNVINASWLSVQMQSDSTSAVVEIKVSNDGTEWHALTSPATEITGSGIERGIDVRGLAQACVEVTTADAGKISSITTHTNGQGE